MYTVGIRISAVFRCLYTFSIGKCRFCYGKYTFTYSRSKRKIVYNFKCRNGDKAETVKYIFEQYAIGVYVKDIIKALTVKGIYNRGKPFARNTVYNILKNEKYADYLFHVPLDASLCGVWYLGKEPRPNAPRGFLFAVGK